MILLFHTISWKCMSIVKDRIKSGQADFMRSNLPQEIRVMI